MHGCFRRMLHSKVLNGFSKVLRMKSGVLREKDERDEVESLVERS